MQFVENGPDVPEPLLQAHEEGRVVFFCGAGISYPAGLPTFKGLVSNIYESLGETSNKIERVAIDNSQYDTAIGLLESRVVGGRPYVRRALARILTPDLSLSGATKTHEALLTLANARSGQSRLITTNFDRLFEVAMNRVGVKIDTFEAPLLPVPKKKWTGLVYLHGRLPVNPNQSDLDRLVISSGDFGIAYLTERWAARFVSELFRNHTVCFVGYSINDPVMRYMMDALAADRLLGEAPIDVFAFGNHAKGKESETIAQWAAKNVTPILYKNHNHHSLLHRTLHAWANTYRDGVRGKEAIVSRYAALKPMGSTRQDDFVGRMIWALCDESGLPAKLLADHTPAPTIDWLSALAEDKFKHHDLVRFGIRPDQVDNPKLAYSLVARPTSYTRSPWMRLARRSGDAHSRWDNVMFQLARWLIRHLDNPELIIWVAKQGGRLDDQFRSLIENELSDKPPRPAMEALWRIAIAGRLINEQNRFDIYSWLRNIGVSGLTPLLRIQFREMLSPMVRIRSSFHVTFEMKDTYESDDVSAVTPADLVQWEIVLSTHYTPAVLQDTATRAAWAAALPALMSDATDLLLDAMDLMRELQGADDKSDPTYWQQPSISDHSQNHSFRDWTSLIYIARDAWLSAAKSRPNAAVREVHRWIDLPYPIFKRLALFAIAERSDLFTSKDLIDLIFMDNSRWLWAKETRREVMRLLSDSSIVIPSRDLAKIQTALLSGPSVELYGVEQDYTKFYKAIDREAWLRLTAIENAGRKIGIKARARLQTLARAYPEWRPASERDEFSVWMTSDDSWLRRSSAPKTIKEIIRWLEEHQSVDDMHQQDDWRERCRGDFRRTSSALFYLAKHDQWLTDRWRQALQAWSEPELIARSWKNAAEQLVRAPDHVIEKLSHSIAWWLKGAAKFVGNQRAFFIRLSLRILGCAQDDKVGDDNDHLMSAINNPIGMTIEAVVNFWYSTQLNDNQGLPNDIAHVFETVCRMSSPSFRHGRLILCANAITLFRVDQAWTENFIIPQFDWSKSHRTAIIAWSGYLWSPRIYRPLIERLSIPFIETSRHYNELGDLSEQYAALLTVVALDDESSIANSEIRIATNNLPEKGLARAVQTIIDGLQSAGDRRVEYWNNRVVPYLRNIWPKSHAVKTDLISEKLAELTIAAGAAFPEALEVLNGWLSPIQSGGFQLYQLSKTSLCSDFPHESLAFLNIIVPNSLQWGDRELRSCLFSMREAWPKVIDDHRFIRLETIVRQLGRN